MLDPRFGQELNVGADNLIETFLAILQPELAHKGKLTSVQVTQLLHRAYLVRYGLANKQELIQNPAALVKMRPTEDTYFGTMLEDHFTHFDDLEIYKYMSWNEYIALPRHELEMVRRLAEKRSKAKNTKENNDLKKVEKDMRDMFKPT